MEQKAREASTLVEIERRKAELRRLATQNNHAAKLVSEVPELAQQESQGKTRDKVAQKIGFKSGHEAERAIKTVKKIDELKQRGSNDDKEKAELLSATPLRRGLHLFDQFSL